MKKTLFMVMTIFAIGISTLFALPSVTFAAPVNLDECDQMFVETMQQLIQQENISEQDVSIDRKTLYDINDVELGYTYTFNTNKTNGYAMSIYQNGTWDVIEFYPNSPTPFSNVKGHIVYVKPYMYLELNDEKYSDVSSGAIVDLDSIELLRYEAYEGTGTMTFHNETFNIVSKNQDDYFQLATVHPKYVGIPGWDNTCTAVAGGNILGYYDRFYTEIIPNYNPCYVSGNICVYYGASDSVDAMMSQLATDMHLNEGEPGATFEDFKSGMQTFCARKNLSVTYNEYITNNTLNYAGLKNEIRAGKPVAMFTRGYQLVSAWGEDLNKNEITITFANCDSSHAMAGFGFDDVTYTLPNNTKKVLQFVNVATNFGDFTNGYLNVNAVALFDHAISVDIH